MILMWYHGKYNYFVIEMPCRPSILCPVTGAVETIISPESRKASVGRFNLSRVKCWPVFKSMTRQINFSSGMRLS